MTMALILASEAEPPASPFGAADFGRERVASWRRLLPERQFKLRTARGAAARSTCPWNVIG